MAMNGATRAPYDDSSGCSKALLATAPAPAPPAHQVEQKGSWGGDWLKKVNTEGDARHRVRSELLLLALCVQVNLRIYEALHQVVLVGDVVWAMDGVIVSVVLLLHIVGAGWCPSSKLPPWLTEFALQGVLTLPVCVLVLSAIHRSSSVSLVLVLVILNKVIITLVMTPLFEYCRTHVALRVCELGLIASAMHFAGGEVPDVLRRLTADPGEAGLHIKEGGVAEGPWVLAVDDSYEFLVTLLPYFLAPPLCLLLACWRMRIWRRRLKEAHSSSKASGSQPQKRMGEVWSYFQRRPQEEKDDVEAQAKLSLQMQQRATVHKHADQEMEMQMDLAAGLSAEESDEEQGQRNATNKANIEKDWEEIGNQRGDGEEGESEKNDDDASEGDGSEEEEEQQQQQQQEEENADIYKPEVQMRAEGGSEGEDKECQSEKDEEDQDGLEGEQEEEDDQEEVEDEEDGEDEEAVSSTDEDVEGAGSVGFESESDGQGDASVDWLERELQNQYQAWMSDINARDREAYEDMFDKECKKEEYDFHLKQKRCETRQDLFCLYLLGQWNGKAACRLPMLDPRAYLTIASFLCYSRSKTLGNFDTADAAAAAAVANASDEEDDDLADPEGYGTDQSSGSLTRAWNSALDIPRMWLSS